MVMQMPILRKMRRLAFSPTLNTVLMVEQALASSKDSVITVAQLKRMLPRQVNHNMFKVILEYLESSNKIAVSLKGLTWIHNRSEKMRAALGKSYGYPKDFLVRSE